MAREPELGNIEVTKIEDLESGNTSAWDALNVDERLKETMVLRQKSAFPQNLKTLVTITHQFCKRDKNASLGLIHRKGMVTRLAYNSPFKGYIFTGDIILTVNGVRCTFEEAPPAPATKQAPAKGSDSPSVAMTLSKLRLGKKKGTQKEKESADFRETVTKVMAQKGDFVKVEIMVARLKTRIPPKIPQGIQVSPNFDAELAIIYLYRYIKLGLTMTQMDKKVYVNYTIPDSVSHLCMNVGEIVLAVDDKPVNTIDEVRQQILNGCNVNGYAQVLVEYPTNDQLKNQVRNQLTVASKDDPHFHPVYAYHMDVRKYMEEGIEALNKGKEPVSILREVTDEKDKKHHKKLPVKNTSTKSNSIQLNENTADVCIPSEWNSKLFVELPGPKTAQAEKAALEAMKMPQPTAAPSDTK